MSAKAKKNAASRGHDFNRLSSEIRRLGHALGDVIAKQEGPDMLGLVEKIRREAKSARSGNRNAPVRLSRLVRSLDLPTGFAIAMAFTAYFELVNLAEENYRVSILRKRRQARVTAHRAGRDAPPIRQSIEAAVATLKKSGVSAREMQAIVDRLSIELVLTAHPTEAKRRTVLSKLKRLGQILRDEAAGHAAPFGAVDDSRIEREITSLWLTERSRTSRPEVLDEVKSGLWYFDNSLWEVLPHLQDDLEQALAIHYPKVKSRSAWLTFGSWIGGDRDGNPSVTASVTAETLVLHRRVALEKLGLSAQQASRLVTISNRREPVPPELQVLLKANEHLSEHVEALAGRYPNEPYRLLLAGLRARLDRAREGASGEQLTNPDAVPPSHALDRREVESELDTIVEGLKSSRAAILAGGEIERLHREVSVFGLQTARLDIRQHSGRHEEAVAEILATFGLCPNYERLGENSKLRVLRKALKGEGIHLDRSRPEFGRLTAETVESLLTAANAQRVYGSESIGLYVISMTNHLSDVLEVQLLMQWCGVVMPISPLFETLDDLDRAPEILTELFHNRHYRRHLDAVDGHQVVMLGYSDSNKDCGYITANWALYKAQENIVSVCRKEKIPVTLFHGRGGSVARGGGPAARAILAQPCGLYDGGIRITEQGEVLSTRYHDPDLAHRILEQTTYGVLLGAHAARRKRAIPAAWSRAMEKMAGAGFDAYRKLVHEDAGFIAFWKVATPIDEISNLNLGSRPTFRRATKSVEDLRAIPWVFSWMQSRFNFPGWFGLGSGLEALLKQGATGRKLLRTMYRDWPFFQTVIDNAQLTLRKADMGIAALYADLVPDEELRKRVFTEIEAEFNRTEAAILAVTGQDEILGNEPILERSVTLRNPYIDPLNYLQVECIRRLRTDGDLPESEREALRDIIHLTINGISGGLKNTG